MQCEEERPENAGGKDNPPSSPSITSADRGRNVQQSATKHDEQSENADKLDRDLVRWTRLLAVFTAALVLAAGLQFWVMRGQLDEMKAARESSDKASADQIRVLIQQSETTRVQTNILRIQMSANITRNRPILSAVTGNDGKKTGWNVNPSFYNVGATDALDWTEWWNLVVLKMAPDSKRPCPFDLGRNEMSSFAVFTAKQSVISSSRFLSIDDAISAQTGTSTIYVMGEFEYKDVFIDSSTHRYTWCVLLMPNDVGKDVFSPFTIVEKKD